VREKFYGNTRVWSESWSSVTRWSHCLPAVLYMYQWARLGKGCALSLPSSPIIQMSSASNATVPSPNFQTILTDALAKYTKQTGKDLLNEPLATKIQGCNSSDEILGVFQEQAQAFQQFRNGDSKLFKWLRPIVNVLYALATDATLATLSAGVSLVSPTNLVISPRQNFNSHLLGIPARKGDLFRYRCTYKCLYLLRYIPPAAHYIWILLDGQVCQRKLRCPHRSLRVHREFPQTTQDLF
jgi:hypothetical protein